MNTDLRAELQTIYDDNNDELIPKVIVKTAKRKTHPLHNHFEWDDKIAGPQFREAQAYALIRSIRITHTNKDGRKEQIRVWHPVRVESPTVYDPIDKIVDDPFMREVLLRQMERAYTELKRKYDTFDEFWQMVGRDAAA